MKHPLKFPLKFEKGIREITHQDTTKEALKAFKVLLLSEIRKIQVAKFGRVDEALAQEQLQETFEWFREKGFEEEWLFETCTSSHAMEKFAASAFARPDKPKVFACSSFAAFSISSKETRRMPRRWQMEPHKKRGAHLEVRSSNPTPRFLSTVSCQSPIWARWQKHALWMLASYSRTGNFKHLLALVRQVHAMRQVSLQ